MAVSVTAYSTFSNSSYNMPRGSTEFESVIRELQTEHIWVPARFSPEDKLQCMTQGGDEQNFKECSIRSTTGRVETAVIGSLKGSNSRPLRRSSTVAGLKSVKLVRTQSMGSFRSSTMKRPVPRRVDSFSFRDNRSRHLSTSTLSEISE